MKVSIQRLTYGRREHPAIGNWLAATAILPATDVDLAGVRFNVGMIDYNDVAVARNIACAKARANNCDVLVMCDADMVPHRNFVKTALLHLRKSPASVVCSPACAARPGRLVNVSVLKAGQLYRVSRAEASRKTGLEKVQCAGSGLIAIGIKALELLSTPYFDRFYNEDHTSVLVTEDMFFTGNLSDAGGDVMAAWDCWSGHDKLEEIGRPEENE